MMPITTYAFLAPIRDDPRSHALLCKMKLDWPDFRAFEELKAKVPERRWAGRPAIS